MLSGFSSVAMELANALINGESNAPLQLRRVVNEFPFIPRPLTWKRGQTGD